MTTRATPLSTVSTSIRGIFPEGFDGLPLLFVDDARVSLLVLVVLQDLIDFW